MAVSQFVNSSRQENIALQAALEDIESKLSENASVTNAFKLIAYSEQDAKKIIARVGGDQSLFIDKRHGGTGGPKAIPASDIYGLTGKFIQFGDETNRSLVIKTTIEISNVEAREKVLTKSFESIYYFHPYRKAFISEAENDKLRAEWR